MPSRGPGSPPKKQGPDVDHPGLLHCLGSVQSAIFQGNLKDLLNMVFFMVLPPTSTSKLLILNRKNGSFTIEWE
jgi:hypothetical protein